MTSIDDDRDPQALRLERMKNDFWVADGPPGVADLRP
jgi:hypothetical protein